jgi:hypothetical protein
VAVLVVDRLEVIEIDERERQRPAGRFRIRDRLDGNAAGMASIRQAGQRVDAGER